MEKEIGKRRKRLEGPKAYSRSELFIGVTYLPFVFFVLGSSEVTGMPDNFIPQHGGYQNLLSFKKARIVYDGTVWFCNHFLNERDRTYQLSFGPTDSPVGKGVFERGWPPRANDPRATD